MQRKPLTAIQAYFIGSLLLMHLLLAAYYFWADDPPESSEEGDTVSLITKRGETALAVSTVKEPLLPEPPEAGHLNLDEMKLEDGAYTVNMDSQWKATLSLDAKMQSFSEDLLKRARVPSGALVVIDLATSDVIVLADRFDAQHPVSPSLEEGDPSHLALRRVAPSASVFKIVTAAALLKTSLKAAKKLTYRPAKRRITLKHLKPVDGGPKSNLFSALAFSNNGYFASAAERYLSQEMLYEAASAFGYNDSVRFATAVEPSIASIPSENLERARTAAGFWHTHLTPLHAAVIAQTVANDGVRTHPRIVSLMTHASGSVQHAPSKVLKKRVMEPSHAQLIEKGLRKTVTKGTAFKAFKNWSPKLKGVKIFGKTGTLGAVKPDRTYTWFVGYTSGTSRDVALAVLAINGEKWWRKAPHIAKDFLQRYARSHKLPVKPRK